MSEQGFGDPPETPQGGPATPPANAWQPVNPPPPPPPGYTTGAQYPPPQPPYAPPAGQYPPPGYPPPGYPPPPAYGQPGYGPPAASGLSTNSAAALSYVTFIPAIIFLVMAPYNKDRFIRFHAWQSIVLSGVWIALSILFLFLAIAGDFGMFFLARMVYLLLRLGLFILWLMAIIQASKGVWFKIPLVGDIAQSIAGKE